MPQGSFNQSYYIQLEQLGCIPWWLRERSWRTAVLNCERRRFNGGTTRVTTADAGILFLLSEYLVLTPLLSIIQEHSRQRSFQSFPWLQCDRCTPMCTGTSSANSLIRNRRKFHNSQWTWSIQRKWKTVSEIQQSPAALPSPVISSGPPSVKVDIDLSYSLHITSSSSLSHHGVIDHPDDGACCSTMSPRYPIWCR